MFVTQIMFIVVETAQIVRLLCTWKPEALFHWAGIRRVV